MAAERHLVGDHHPVADPRVVPDMRARHEQPVVAHPRDAAAARGTDVHRGPLADAVAPADAQARALAGELEVLRHLAEDGAREHRRAVAHMGVARDHDVGPKLDLLAQHDLRAQDAERAHAAARADPCAGIDDRGGVDLGAGPVAHRARSAPPEERSIMAVNSASRDGLAAHRGRAPEAQDARALARDLHGQLQRVAGHHHAAELGLLDRHQVDQEPGVHEAFREAHKDARGLPPWPPRTGRPGMIGAPGKWPWKCGSLTVTSLTPVALRPGTTSRTRSIIRNG